MLEDGPPGRKLGEAHPAVSGPRLARERQLVAELRALREAAGEPIEGDDFDALLEEHLDVLRDELDEACEEASKAYATHADEVEAAGFSIVELNQKLRAARARSRWRADRGDSDPGDEDYGMVEEGEDEGEGEGEGEGEDEDEEDEDEGDSSSAAAPMDVAVGDAASVSGASSSRGAARTVATAAAAAAFAECRKCHRRSRVAALPILRPAADDADSSSGGTGGASMSAADLANKMEGVGRSEGRSGLCHVCAAEAELDARAPVERRHGKVLEKGASGFTGWTSGLRRTSDPALLRRMYKAKRPDDVAKINISELAAGRTGD